MRRGKKKKRSWFSTVDFLSFCTRIIHIYTRATFKFGIDEQLVMEYLHNRVDRDCREHFCSLFTSTDMRISVKCRILRKFSNATTTMATNAVKKYTYIMKLSFKISTFFFPPNNYIIFSRGLVSIWLRLLRKNICLILIALRIYCNTRQKSISILYLRPKREILFSIFYFLFH